MEDNGPQVDDISTPSTLFTKGVRGFGLEKSKFDEGNLDIFLYN